MAQILSSSFLLLSFLRYTIVSERIPQAKVSMSVNKDLVRLGEEVRFTCDLDEVSYLSSIQIFKYYFFIIFEMVPLLF